MPHRRYTKREKLAAVMATEMSGVVAAEKATGIPESTIRYWLDRPEFAEFRAKTREELGQEIKLVSHLAWKRIAESLRSGEMEPRDAIFAAEKATNLQLLMSGEATGRTEHRDLSSKFGDHENDVLSEVIRAELERRSNQSAADSAVEVAEQTGAARPD